MSAIVEVPAPARARDRSRGGEHVAQAVAPPAGHPRFALIDGVRALAALSVLLTHVGFASSAAATPWYRLLSRLDIGVAIFFVIAGFLLFRPYLAEHVDGLRAPSFARYLSRRALRILPAYWLALSALALTGLIAFDSAWWQHYALVQIYSGPQWFMGIHATWSLATEATFYLALPLLVVVLRAEASSSRRGRMSSGVWLVGSLWVLSWAFRLSFRALHGSNNSIWFNTLPGMLDWFAIGMGLAVLSVAMAKRTRRPLLLRLLERHPGLSWLMGAALFAIVSFGLGNTGTWGLPRTETQWLALHLLYGAVALCVIAPAVFPGEGRAVVHRLLGNRLAAGLGLISYGIFLYNGPIVSWVSHNRTGQPFGGLLFLTLVVTLPVAAASYWFVERPLLAFKNASVRVRGSHPRAEVAPSRDSLLRADVHAPSAEP